MTISELLERVLPHGSHYDPKFARKFRSVTTAVCFERERLSAAPPDDYRAAKKYFDSWSQYLDLFADDPRSLAALTVPRVRIRGKQLCANEVSELFPESLTGTPTVQLALYFLKSPAKKPGSKPKSATSQSKTASKTVKASKRK